MRFFISHSSADKALAVAMAELIRVSMSVVPTLHVAGYTGPRAGSDWRDWIRTVARNADVVVLLATESSRESPWVAFEMGLATAAALHAGLPRIDVLYFCARAPDAVPEVVAHLQAVDAASAGSLAQWFTDLGADPNPEVIDRFCTEAARLLGEIDVSSSPEAMRVLGSLGVLRRLTVEERARVEALGADLDGDPSPHPSRRAAVRAIEEITRSAFVRRSDPPPNDDLDDWLRYLNRGAVARDGGLQLRMRLPLPRDDAHLAFVHLFRLRVDLMLRTSAEDLARIGVCFALFPTEAALTHEVEGPPRAVVDACIAERVRLQSLFSGAQLVHLGTARSDAMSRLRLPLPHARTVGPLLWELPRGAAHLSLAASPSGTSGDLTLEVEAGPLTLDPHPLGLRGPYAWKVTTAAGRPLGRGVVEFLDPSEKPAGWAPDAARVADWVRLAREEGDGPHLQWLLVEVERAHIRAVDILSEKLPQFGEVADAWAALGGGK